MEAKRIQWIIKGMLRDVSASKFSPQHAYENYNIRLTARDSNTLLSITNEKGNKLIVPEGLSGGLVVGDYLGHGIINNIVIIFTIEDATEQERISRLYRLIYDTETESFTGELFYEGNLNFSAEHPIETISIYENENIQKIYWTDGLNSPRFVNVAPTVDKAKFNDNYFNFAPSLQLNEVVTIERNLIASGIFAPGVIQYAFTYFNKYGLESNVFYTSPLLYVSYNDRGGSPEDKVSNSFDINLDNIDPRFDYVRVYAIHRSSIEATPEVRHVADLAASEIVKTITLTNTTSGTSTLFTNSEPATIKIRRNTDGYEMEVLFLGGGETGTFAVNGGDQVIFYELGTNNPLFICEFPTYNKIKFTRTLQESGDIDYLVESVLLIPSAFNYGTTTTEDTVTKNVRYTDSGTAGSIIDPSILLYIGGEDIIAGTITHKDNTMFLGNIELTRNLIPENVRNYLRNLQPTFQISSDKISPTPTQAKGYYPYENNLKQDSYKIKTFKYLEWYRMGILFQHYTGKWSEPLWVKDVRNEVKPVTHYLGGGLFQNEDMLPTLLTEGVLDILNTDDYNQPLSELVDNGYVRARSVICYPSITDREVVAQGILCPTVFNVGDRYSNSPFAQSSWFSRPNSPVNVDTNAAYLNSQPVDKGAWAEYRHHKPIPDNLQRNAEIQCLVDVLDTPYTTETTDSAIASFVRNNAENFFVDLSIVTFHSPEIEFDDNIKNLDSSNLKLRIVGLVPLTANASDIDIITSTPAEVSPFHPEEYSIGFYKEVIGSLNVSPYGWKSMLSGIFWVDELANYNAGDPNEVDKGYALKFGYAVYPWHRNGSLNNHANPVGDDTERSAMLKHKKMSNLKFSTNSVYYNTNDIWYAYEEGHNARTGISGVTIFNSDQLSLVKIPAPKNSPLDAINYYGNIDKVLNITRTTESKKKGYPIVVADYNPFVSNEMTDPHNLFTLPWDTVENVAKEDNNPATNDLYGTEPISMKYKSSPHAVIALNYTNDSSMLRILPVVGDIEGTANTIPMDGKGFWRAGNITEFIYRDIQPSALSSIVLDGHGFFWLAELYNDTIDENTRFGGTTPEALENNQWFPASDPVSLVGESGEPLSTVTLKYLEGDTFYQRYDHLKTYPFTLEDLNSVVDIVSFMVESRINLDGRYDRNRGQTSNLVMSPENFNKMNPVYSQKNNFFNYRALNYERFSLNSFPNTVTWTKTKTLGEITDTWTNITMASVLDMDGDKGKINALRRFNNEIYCFQDKGISRVLFNSRVLIPTSEGLPIEIANSYKVDGKVYMSEEIGCTNKHSIVTTPDGLYFIDNNTNALYIFSGQQPQNVSDNFGFRTFLVDNNSQEVWNSVDFSNFISFYDKNNEDIYFINSNYCLGFNRLLKLFTSFYSYEKVPLMFNLGDNLFALKDNKLYHQFAGHYNVFFGETKPFYTILIANPDEPEDKIFSTINYRADTFWGDKYLPDITFDKFSIWNEYLSATVNLSKERARPSNLKKKFRMWNIKVPRDSANLRDRIRNPWAFIKLEMSLPSVYKTELHDVILNYFI